MDEYLLLKGINLKLFDLPRRVKALHTVNPDGGYTILVNKNLSFEARHEAILHELSHIERKDLESSLSADRLEVELYNA